MIYPEDILIFTFAFVVAALLAWIITEARSNRPASIWHLLIELDAKLKRAEENKEYSIIPGLTRERDSLHKTATIL